LEVFGDFDAGEVEYGRRQIEEADELAVDQARFALAVGAEFWRNVDN